MVVSGYGIRELGGNKPAIGRHHFDSMQLRMVNTIHE